MKPRKKNTSRRPVHNKPLRLEWIEAGSLADNPSNWRRHPKGQTTALKTMLGDVGWAGALLYNEQTGRLIDGHARKDAVDPKTVVPVLVGRWSEDQEMKILATLDPLGAMAEADAGAMESLLAEVDLNGKGLDDLTSLLDLLADDPEEEDRAPAQSRAGKASATPRKRGPRVMRFTCGSFTFDVPRQHYDSWLSDIESKTGSDADQVIKELKRRLKL